MSKNKSAHQLIRKNDRTIGDYLDLFSGRNTEEEITTVTNDRYEKLYNLSKIKQAKEENLRQKIKEQRDIEELAECSFVPKINKEYKHKRVDLIKKKNSFNKSRLRDKSEDITDQIIQDLLKRQDEWVKKKNKKIEINKLRENNKINENLLFAPEINRNKQKFFNDMKLRTQEIVADPESYKEYIDRNKKNMQNYVNINSNKYFRKNKNYLNNNKYDYTQHKLLNKNIIKNTSFSKNKIHNNNKQSKSVDLKKNIINKSKYKISNIKNEDIYSMIYFDSKEKYENKINKGFSEKEKKNIFNGKTQLDFKEALDSLHHLLINLNIIEDNDDDINDDNNI
jgi:hypothetical protein